MDLKLIKCVIVGDCNSGKTALLEAFSQGIPTNDQTEYCPTVINYYEATTQVGDDDVTMALFDTSGESGTLKLRKCLYPQTKVVIVAFSLFEPRSFENAKTKWVPEIRSKCPGVPWILVGTHADLRSDNAALALLRAQQSQGPISAANAEATARDLQASRFVECSSVNMAGVVRVFHEAISAARTAELHRLQRVYEKESQEAVFGSATSMKRASGTSVVNSVRSSALGSIASLINKRSKSAASLGSRSNSLESIQPKKPRFMRPQHKSKNIRVSRDELKATIQFVPTGSKHESDETAYDPEGSDKGNVSKVTRPPILKKKPVVPPRPILPVYKFGNGDAKIMENELDYMEPVRVPSSEAPIYAAIPDDDSDYEN